ncbi:MAG: MFS transporter [Acidobacteria bacterium]|nr:MFS transporter [Acidobacteriota bacterium]
MVDLLRRNRDLRLLFFAQVVSFLGDWFADVALLGLVLDLTNSPLAASLVMVSTTLPAFLLAPLAGPMVDTFDRRKLIMAVSVFQVGAALLLLGVGEGTVWLAFVARAAIGGLAAFIAPASQAAIPNLVEPADLPRANALLGSVWGAMLAIGAAVGGGFTVLFGRGASFVADAVTFVVAALLVAAIRRPMSAPRDAHTAPMRPIADSVVALRYAASNRPVLLLLFSKTGLGLAGGVLPLLAVYGKDVFDHGDAGIGLLLAARGLGAVLGPLVGQRWLRRRGPTIDPTTTVEAATAPILFLCGAAALLYGVGYVAVAASPVIGVAMVGALLAHLGGGGQWMLSNLGLQLATPDELRGRVFAADFALVTLSMSSSFLLSGWASDRFGPRPVTLVFASIAALWGVLYLSLTRTLRTTHAPPRAAAPAPAAGGD